MDHMINPKETNFEQLFESGWNCYEVGDNAKVLAMWKEAAELGYPKAQHYVAVCYKSEIGTKKDKTITLEWHRMSAQQLFLRAINRMHELGEWIFDPNETDSWFGTTLLDYLVILLPQS